MSQHDFNIANQSFPATRTDLNNALQALASNSSGDAEPSTTFANQWWYETDTNTLKLRNEANNAWLSFATVDQSTAAWTLAHDVDITGTLTSDGLTVAGATSLTGNLSVDGGTIKLDGNYPVGTNNVALGDTALDSLTSGIRNTAIGSWALTANTEGNENTAVGEISLAANISGNSNVAFGRASLNANTTASYNTAYGTDSLQVNTTGGNNTAVGHRSLFSNTTASSNTAVGYQAGYSNTTGGRLTAFGYQAGYNCTATGTIQNVFVGNEAGHGNTSGTNNTYIGGSSASQMTTGSFNTIIGAYDGNSGGLDIRTSSNNIVLSDGDGNPRVIVDSSGAVSFGGPLTVIELIADGVQGVVIDGPNGVLAASRFNDLCAIFKRENSNGPAVNFMRDASIVGSIAVTESSTAYNTSSDYRLKENVNYTWDATTRLKQLKPAQFNFIADADTTVDGFLAHEAQEIVPECVTGAKDAVNADGAAVMQGIDQSKLVPLLVKTIQELEARITALEGN
jgi:hypothetical protein